MRESIARRKTPCALPNKNTYTAHTAQVKAPKSARSRLDSALAQKEREGAHKNKNATSRQTLDWGRASKQLWCFPIWWWHCSGHVLWMPLCVHSNVCYPFTTQLIYQSYSPATSCCESYQATALTGESINYSPPCDWRQARGIFLPAPKGKNPRFQ